MDRLLGFPMGGGMGGGRAAQPGVDQPMNDTAETVYISSLALLKMLKHGKAGIPLEVMGNMLGDYIDDYTVKCVDVFAMPQSGTETTIEAIDEAFQAKMSEMLRQTGRNEIVVGWYHSHPGFGCFLSSVDVNTQKTFEQLNPRFVAVVVDPVQSVRGKVVIDAFRSYGGMLPIGDQDMRQTTSNLGNFSKTRGFSLKDLAKISYYSLLINYRKNELETKMLLNLHKSKWDQGFRTKDAKVNDDDNLKKIDEINKLCEKYALWIDSEVNKSSKEIYMQNVGKFNPKEHLDHVINEVLTDNMNQCLTSMLNNLVF
jgi:26S proteasome regulatory subunit N11